MGLRGVLRYHQRFRNVGGVAAARHEGKNLGFPHGQAKALRHLATCLFMHGASSIPCIRLRASIVRECWQCRSPRILGRQRLASPEPGTGRRWHMEGHERGLARPSALARRRQGALHSRQELRGRFAQHAIAGEGLEVPVHVQPVHIHHRNPLGHTGRRPAKHCIRGSSNGSVNIMSFTSGISAGPMRMAMRAPATSSLRAKSNCSGASSMDTATCGPARSPFGYLLSRQLAAQNKTSIEARGRLLSQ